MGGILYTIQSTFYFSAVRYISASLAVLILYLYPVLVAILAAVVDKENFRGKYWRRPAWLSGTGYRTRSAGGQSGHVRGCAGVGAALIYSVYIILGRRVVAQVHPLVTTAFIAAFAAV